jgi:hypothetical protein
MATARDKMIDVEKLSDLELDELDKTYQKIRTSAQRRHAEKSKETSSASTR